MSKFNINDLSEEDLEKFNKCELNDEGTIYPIKCPCGCEETERSDECYESPYGLVEYQLKCKNCGTYLGIWYYGYWSY